MRGKYAGKGTKSVSIEHPETQQEREKKKVGRNYPNIRSWAFQVWLTGEELGNKKEKVAFTNGRKTRGGSTDGKYKCKKRKKFSDERGSSRIKKRRPGKGEKKDKREKKSDLRIVRFYGEGPLKMKGSFL